MASDAAKRGEEPGDPHSCTSPTQPPLPATTTLAHYRAIAPATHVALADRALTWRATGRVDDRDTAAAPLTTELFALHHQIFERLSRDQRLPRTAELADRAAQFSRNVPDVLSPWGAS